MCPATYKINYIKLSHGLKNYGWILILINATTYMTFTHLKSPINFKYVINGTTLQSLDKSVTDLSILFSVLLLALIYIVNERAISHIKS